MMKTTLSLVLDKLKGGLDFHPGLLGGVGWSKLSWLQRFRLYGVYRPIGC